jgi:hypothetical protein
MKGEKQFDNVRYEYNDAKIFTKEDGSNSPSYLELRKVTKLKNARSGKEFRKPDQIVTVSQKHIEEFKAWLIEMLGGF